MKISFFSNSLNHHQLPFCRELIRLIGTDFTFVSTEPVTEERLKLGYTDMNHAHDFVLNAYEGREAEALQLLADSDVVIFGSAPEKYMKERMKHRKLTFRYSERPLKQSRRQLLNLHTLKTMLHLYTRYVFAPQYLLCASAYTAGDCALVGAYWGKAYRWGYFPEIHTYDTDELLKKKQSNAVLNLLWVGRLISWKHPMDALAVAEALKRIGVPFVLNIIGIGEQEEMLKETILDKKLEDFVHLLGAMSPENVRDHMEKADIFLFTSDRSEGWGAVLNEAMNSGCAVVTNREIGSVPFLIDDKKNGLLYQGGNVRDLIDKVLYLAENPIKMAELGMAAYETMVTKWSPAVAADRFLKLSAGLMEGKHIRFSDGPCSKARWM